VLTGDASPALLDTYQPERDPHVRAITALAIFMGRVVCTQNAEEAARRDADMTSKPEAERMGGGLPPLEGLKTGILAGHPAAGQIAPEPRLADGRRIDEVIGFVPYVITRGAKPSSFAAGGHVFGMDEVKDEHGVLAVLMGDASAILVRPDRLVFGAGEAGALVDAWDAYLRQSEAALA
jgi:3-(3-hydroxy-phenyl)propionate hydroxylase